MQLTTNFALEEFACRDGTPVPDVYLDNVRGLACNLQRIRNHFRLPIKIISGYRTPSHNARVGGAERSQHLIARAADIQVVGVPPDEVGRAIRVWIRDRALWEGGVGVYSDFVHYDIRGVKARWRG